MNRFRLQLQEIESNITAIAGANLDSDSKWMRNSEMLCSVKGLLSDRQTLLNKMFQPTPEAMRHFNAVNNRLCILSQQLQERMRKLNEKRSLIMDCPDFDDDLEIEGRLAFSFNDENSVLKLADDDYYCSDFARMICLIDSLIHHSTDWHALECIHPHSPKLDNDLNWNNDFPFIGCEEFKNIKICYAVHNLTDHLGYSIPDLIRLNDFWCEVRLTLQSITEQNGTRYIPSTL